MSLEQLDRCIGAFGHMASGWTATTGLDTMRSELERFYVGYPELPGATVEHIDAGVPAEQVAAPGVAADRMVLVLHGGGFSMGSARSHRSFAGFLSRACDAQIVTIDYRLVPEHPYPAALDDAVEAYRRLRNAGFKPGRIAVSGDSAGGGLALALLMRLRGAGEAQPGCAVLLSPWTDMRCRSDSYTRNAAIDPIASHDIGKAMGLGYVGPEGDLDDPLASPLIGDYRNLPPLFLQAGSREVFLDEPTTIGERVREAGGEATVDIRSE